MAGGNSASWELLGKEKRGTGHSDTIVRKTIKYCPSKNRTFL